MAKNKRIFKLTLEEDSIEYFLFPKEEYKDNSEDHQRLNNLLKDCNTYIQKYTKDYLWHCEEFKLNVRSSDALLNNDNLIGLKICYFIFL